MLLVLATLAVASAATFEELLAKGPVSVVETEDDGRLRQITVYARVDAPIDAVWQKLVRFADYAAWMPQVDSSEVISETATQAEVAWSIRVPGPNFNYTATYAIDAGTHTVVITGKSGGLSGGRWQWQLSELGGATLVERTTFASAVIDNWILRQFDDRQHSLELGLNAASPLIEVRGLKVAVERSTP